MSAVVDDRRREPDSAVDPGTFELLVLAVDDAAAKHYLATIGGFEEFHAGQTEDDLERR